MPPSPGLPSTAGGPPGSGSGRALTFQVVAGRLKAVEERYRSAAAE
ncbi:hypothetical protein MTF65_26355 [Streptomyces sp. APSN-46.1]|nr:hypothetical protein [Streptomyces sp. APSN-46.1]MCJ1680806.1 hypothetical protein [Streptomyces sp. APSN-46.1]